MRIPNVREWGEAELGNAGGAEGGEGSVLHLLCNVLGVDGAALLSLESPEELAGCLKARRL